MKSIVLAVLLLAISRIVSATTIQIYGLSPLNTTTLVNNMGWTVYYGNCQFNSPTTCLTSSYLNYNLTLNQFFSQLTLFNTNYFNVQLTKSSYGQDSMFSFQLQGSSSVCNANLSNKANVNIFMQPNGSCVAS